MSIETKLAEAVTEIRGINVSLTNEVNERRRDHDELVKLKERVITLFNKATALETEDRSIEEDIQKFRPLVEKVKALEDWKNARDNSEHTEVKAIVKETKKRSWQFWMMVLGAIVGAIASSFVGGLVAKYLFK